MRLEVLVSREKGDWMSAVRCNDQLAKMNGSLGVSLRNGITCNLSQHVRANMSFGRFLQSVFWAFCLIFTAMPTDAYSCRSSTKLNVDA